MRAANDRRGFGLVAAFCGLVAALSACGGTQRNGPMEQAGNAGQSGSSGSTGAQDGGGASAGGTNGGAAAGFGGSLGGTVGEGGDVGMGGDAPIGPLAPVPGGIRRLTAAEYGYTVADVLGTKLLPNLDEFTVRLYGYDNNADANTVPETLYQRYLETAEKLADEVFTTPTLKQSYVTCATADDETCVRGIASRTGLRLFRQPLVAGELDAYVGAYKNARARGQSHDDSLKELLTALLASAQFVMRIEYPANPTGPQPISPFELGTRLSYLLWSSAPDDSLLQAAASDQLGTDAEVDATVERLLANPKAARFNKSFGGQWLEAWKVAQLVRDPKYAWTPTLAKAATEEMHSFFGELVTKDLDVRELWTSKAHFVDASLATLYGVAPPGAGTVRVELAGDRQGLLGLAGFLALSSYNARTSPTTRGLYIRDRLLCQQVPAPPANIPPYTGTEEGIRPYLDGLEPVCRSCHALMDPLGLALENYDAIGRFRTVYPDATIIDPSVSLPPDIAGNAVSGAASLSDALADVPDFELCVAQQLYTYGMGRVDSSTLPNAQALASNWQLGAPTLRELIHDLVRSPTFRQRSDGGAQ